MHSKNFRTTICFMISIVLCSSIHAQIGCLCDINVIYQIVDDSEKYDYQFFYRKIKDTDVGSCTVNDESYMYYIWEKIINSDIIIHRAKTYIGTSPDKHLGKAVSWHNTECCYSQIKGYLVITEKSTKQQQIISFPILDEVDAYWFKGCRFKKGAYKIIKYNYPDLYYSDKDLVPCENDLPPNFIKRIK